MGRSAPRRVLADASVDVFEPGKLLHYDGQNRLRYTVGANGAVTLLNVGDGFWASAELLLAGRPYAITKPVLGLLIGTAAGDYANAVCTAAVLALDADDLLARDRRIAAADQVRCWPRETIESGRVTADALISIGADERNLDRDAQFDVAKFGGDDAVIRAYFDDLPLTEWTDRHGRRWYGPTAADIERLLAFGRRLQAADIAVHCLHGRSRSAAVALMLIADRLGPGGEALAVDLLLAHGEAHGIRVQPNPQIVVLADNLLGRRRALVTALGERCEQARTWREYWERHGWAEEPQPAAEFPPPRDGLQQEADALLAATGLPYSDVAGSAVLAERGYVSGLGRHHLG